MKKSNNNIKEVIVKKVIILPMKTTMMIKPDWSFETIRKTLMLAGFEVEEDYCKRVYDHYYLKAKQ